MKSLALAVAFLLEVIALIEVASLGYFISRNNNAHLASAVVLLVALSIFWGRYMAPKAPNHLTRLSYYIAKALIYLVAAASLWFRQLPVWSLLFVAAAILDDLYLFKSDKP